MGVKIFGKNTAGTDTNDMIVNDDGSVNAVLVTGDIEIGAVEIKNHNTDDRVEVGADNRLSANANLQVADTDVANGNPVPVSDAGTTLSVDDGAGSLTVDGTIDATIVGSNTEGTTGAAVPSKAVQIAGTDGTNLQVPRVEILSDGAGISRAGIFANAKLFGYDGANLQMVRVDAQKNLLVGLRSSGGQEPGVSGMSSDAISAAALIGMAVRAGGYGYNDATWDRWRNNTEGTLLASAARTAATNSANQTNHNSRGVQVILNVTAASGTGGLSVLIRGIDPISGLTYTLNPTPTLITTSGRFAYEVYPGASGTVPGSTTGLLVQRIAGALPRSWRIEVAVGDASSYTYSVGFALIV